LGVFPSLWNIFLGRAVFGEVFLGMKFIVTLMLIVFVLIFNIFVSPSERIPFADVPTDSNASAEWLLNNFIVKVLFLHNSIIICELYVKTFVIRRTS